MGGGLGSQVTLGVSRGTESTGPQEGCEVMSSGLDTKR